ncbi:MAG: tRNA 2-thiocytidine(32) synthetase TtcA, partial [Erysipelotrichaceae bacterium]|nr:tRNA 2-thiocytidine(32) synthetase TtcA [Erysipelotrichaceae bacterium]
MSMKKILGSLRKADEMFSLIEAGDKIAVGLSGGKDSSLLLHALHLYQYLYENAYHEHFDIVGVHIDLHFGEEDITPLLDFFRKENVEVHYEASKIADILALHKKNDQIQCS